MRNRFVYKAIVFLAGLVFLGLGLSGAQAKRVIAPSCVSPQMQKPIPPEVEPFACERLSIRIKGGDDHFFNVELAVTDHQQEYGLMNRTRLPEDYGMLFVFPEAGRRIFWMKDTLVPLDMLFISADGTINHIHPDAKPRDLTSIRSETPSMAVLELKGGGAKRQNIQVGDQVVYKAFAPQSFHAP